jgi:hypothetical protein
MKRTSQILLTFSLAVPLVACDTSNKNQATAAGPPAAAATATAATSGTVIDNANEVAVNAPPVNTIGISRTVEDAGNNVPANAQRVSSDPPSRVARLAYLVGDVQFSPAGESQWDRASRNRPLVTGDRLLTGSNGRAALELGDSAVRINDNTAFDLLTLDDRTAQIELSQGALNLRVRQLDAGQNYEVDTPVLAFVADQPGNYRIDEASDGSDTIVTVFDGGGTVYGENGISRVVEAHHSYRFDNPQLANVSDQGLPPPDDFDRDSSARDDRYSRSVSRRYVSADVIGYDDLDNNGDWQTTADYGEVWYPTHVATNWAPYRDGQWEWVDPYGWTWVDNASWGFAPYHYGRWVRIDDRWGWIPGPPVKRAVYAPALVAFVGGSGLRAPNDTGGNGEPVGWFPLGPNDVYRPPYRVSRTYFNNVNVTNISVVNNTSVNNTVINNDYNSYNTPNGAPPINYTYRSTPPAVTVVPRNVFVGARQVAPAVLAVEAKALAVASVQPIPPVAPTIASLGGKSQAPPTNIPGNAFRRPVIARTAPPQPVPFIARERLITQQGGAPVSLPQLRQLQQNRANNQPIPPRVRLIVPAVPTPGIAGVSPSNTVREMPNGPMHASAAQQQQAQRATEQARVAQQQEQQAKRAADQARAAQQQQAQRAAEQARVAQQQQEQQAKRAADQARAAQQQQAQRAAEQARMAQQQEQQAKHAADQARAAQQQQAQRAAEQARMAQQQEQQAKRAADQARAAQQQQAQRAAEQARVAQQQQEQQAKRAADQARAAQQQQAQRAAEQARVAQQQQEQQAKRAADQARAAQQQQAEHAANQAHSAQQQPAPRTTEQERAAQLQAQRVAAKHRKLQSGYPAPPQSAPPQTNIP